MGSNGNVYVADTYNYTIRKLAPTGTNWFVSTIAGLAGSLGYADGTNSRARFAYPYGVAVDSRGNVYVADDKRHCSETDARGDKLGGNHYRWVGG